MKKLRFVITGNPGVGKHTTAKIIAEKIIAPSSVNSEGENRVKSRLPSPCECVTEQIGRVEVPQFVGSALLRFPIEPAFILKAGAT